MCIYAASVYEIRCTPHSAHKFAVIEESLSVCSHTPVCVVYSRVDTTLRVVYDCRLCVTADATLGTQFCSQWLQTLSMTADLVHDCRLSLWLQTWSMAEDYDCRLGLWLQTWTMTADLVYDSRLWLQHWSMTAELVYDCRLGLWLQTWSMTADLVYDCRLGLWLQTMTADLVHDCRLGSITVGYDCRLGLWRQTWSMTADLVYDRRIVYSESRPISELSTGEYTTLLCNWRISYKSPVTLLSHLQKGDIFLSHIRLRRVTHMNESCVTFSNDVVTTLVRDYTNRFAVGYQWISVPYLHRNRSAIVEGSFAKGFVTAEPAVGDQLQISLSRLLKIIGLFCKRAL